MEIRAAVVDPLPLYRRGVAAALEEVGCAVDVPDDVRVWRTEAEIQIVLLGLCGVADWQLLGDLHTSRPDLLLVAMIDTPETRAYVRALRSGAAAAVPRASSPTALQRSFTALIDGQVILPSEAVRALAMAGRSAEEDDPRTPSAEELCWLRRLASGGTVAELANEAGYSERMMFRRLREVYSKLSARNRTEALIYARDTGWI